MTFAFVLWRNLIRLVFRKRIWIFCTYVFRKACKRMLLSDRVVLDKGPTTTE
jgi:hypothetical protein